MLIISPAGHFLGAINRPPTHDSPLTALPYHLLSPVFPCSCLTAFLFPPHRSRLTPHRSPGTSIVPLTNLSPITLFCLTTHRSLLTAHCSSLPPSVSCLLTPDSCLLPPIPHYPSPMTTHPLIAHLLTAHRCSLPTDTPNGQYLTENPAAHAPVLSINIPGLKERIFKRPG